MIGTSVAFAARAAGLRVELYDALPEMVRRAEDLGAGVAGKPSWEAADERAVEPVDVVVLATPPSHLAEALARAQQRALGRTYTDVGSVKVTPLAEAAARGCDLFSFVGGHPMAGRERSGPGAARADLFRGRPWVLTPAEPGGAHLARVRALVDLCGAVPVVLDPAAHDEAVALVSHVPHLVSSLMAARLAEAPAGAVALAGQGLRDVTRIAGSDPALWTAILSANAAPVRAVLQHVSADLDVLLEALDALSASLPVARSGDRPDDALRAVTAVLTAGVTGRGTIPGKHGAPPTTYAVVPVVVPDRPGELARLFVAAGEAGINVEDVTIEHSPGQPVGSVELAVRPDAADALAVALRRRGWTVHREVVDR